MNENENLTQEEMSELDKAILENKKAMQPKEKGASEEEIRAKVLAELKANEEKEALVRQNKELAEKMKQLEEAQKLQKEKFEEELKKFSGNANTDSTYQSKGLDIKTKLNGMSEEDFKSFEETQREETLELFRRRAIK